MSFKGNFGYTFPAAIILAGQNTPTPQPITGRFGKIQALDDCTVTLEAENITGTLQNIELKRGSEIEGVITSISIGNNDFLIAYRL